MATATLNRKNIDMTEGKLFGKILVFVLPLIVTNLLQVFYNVADMIVVGYSTEADAVGAVGVTGAFVNLIFNVVLGVSVGVNVVVAQRIGAKDKEGVSKVIHTSVVLLFLFGLLSGIVGFFISRPVLSLMGNRGKLLDLATLYTKIYFCGAPFIALTNCAVAIFRAKGDTKTPLIILSLSGVFNVIANLVFVFLMGMSVEGVALATALSNVLSAVLLFACLAKDKGICHFSIKKLSLYGKTVKEILAVGIPSGIQGALFSLSNMIIMSSIIKVNNLTVPVDSAYQPVVKGNAASSSLEGFAYTATNAVHQAAVAFTGQNCGAKKPERVKKVMVCCYVITFIVAVLSAGSLVLFRNPLLALYGVHDGVVGSLEHVAYETAIIKMKFLWYTYFLLAFMEVGSGILRGQGHSTLSAIISLIGAVIFRIIWISTVFEAYPTLNVIYVSYPISWCVTSIVFLIANLIKLNKKIRANGGQNV